MKRRGRYCLGPPLWIAQEIYDPATSRNPSFELSYWRWALEVAQQWRERLGQPRDKKWDDIIDRLSPLPVQTASTSRSNPIRTPGTTSPAGTITRRC